MGDNSLLVLVGQESELGLPGTSGCPVRLQSSQGFAGEDLLPSSLTAVDRI